MPRAKAIHLNSPEDDQHAACGRHLERILWTLNPNQVTCQACKKAMQS